MHILFAGELLSPTKGNAHSDPDECPVWKGNGLEVGERPLDAKRQRFYAYVDSGAAFTEVTAPNMLALERKAIAAMVDQRRAASGLAPMAHA